MLIVSRLLTLHYITSTLHVSVLLYVVILMHITYHTSTVLVPYHTHTMTYHIPYHTYVPYYIMRYHISYHIVPYFTTPDQTTVIKIS